MKRQVYISVSTDPIKEYQMICEYAKEMQNYADFLHCDIMDGKFVEGRTYDSQLVSNINQNSLIMLDVHLMCDEPLKLIDEYIKAGANIITVHYEAFKNKNDIMVALEKIKEGKALAGLAINPETSVNEIKVYIHDFDIIMVMSVEPGASGQKFIAGSEKKVAQLNEIRENNNFKYKIEIDGGINATNVKDVISAGADIIVSGNFVYKSNNRQEAITLLKG